MKFSIAVNMTRRRPDVPMETVVAQALELFGREVMPHFMATAAPTP